MQTITLKLAQLLHASTPADIPAHVVHEAKRALVNWIGTALGGCRDEGVKVALETISEFADCGQATVIGHRLRLDSLNAALINGISSNILDFDDTHARIVVHPTASIACALLALCEARSVSGVDFLHALVLGIEVECRLLDPRVAEYKFAWSPTTSVAALGAAAACSRALRLTPQQIACALGIAATQASGLRETGGSMSKPFNAGHAARCGLIAALLAARGFTGAETAIEGPKGFISAFGEPREVDTIVESWGDTYHLELNTYKAFPCGIVAHPAISGCLEMYADGIRSDIIEAVQLTVHPMAERLTGRKRPIAPLDAKLSVYHAAAAALVYGKVSVKEFSPGCISDPRVVQLRDKIRVVVNESYAMDEAEVELKLTTGRAVKKHIDHAIGSLQRPMSDAALDDKLRSLAEDVLTDDEIRALLARLWSLDRAEDAGAIARALVSASVNPV
ncbi:MAG: MmgE/PrpD family protein [Burkholderiales bacterium]